jgi:hypothetical protein
LPNIGRAKNGLLRVGTPPDTTGLKEFCQSFLKDHQQCTHYHPHDDHKERAAYSVLSAYKTSALREGAILPSHLLSYLLDRDSNSDSGYTT